MVGIVGGLLGAAGSIIGGIAAGNAADNAADAQVQANRDSIAYQEKIYEDQQARFDPFYQGGLNAFDAYLYEMGLGSKPNGYEGITASPSSQFALTQGVNALENSAAAGGGLYRGSTGMALEDYRANLMLADRDNQLNRLGALGSTGQQAAGMIGNAQTNLGSSVTNAMGNIGNSQAAGSIAGGNAFNNALGGFMGGASQVISSGFNPTSSLSGPSFGPGSLTVY